MAKIESHIPKLRFAGFSDIWQKKKLSEISFRVQEKNKNNQVTETFTNSAERGIISQRDFFDKDISNEANLDNYYVVQPDDFVYNPRISNFAPVGPIKRNKLGRSGVMSPLYSVFRPNQTIINFDFLEHYFSTTNWHKFMFTHGDQGARSDRFAIGMATFQKMPIDIPEFKEQTKIGDFFQKIDQVIELQQKALETAQDYKKSMLQKMFPQKGEKMPKVRFDGFSGDWEEKKLKDIVVLLKDGTHGSHADGVGAYLLSAKNIKNKKVVLDKNKDRQISQKDYELIYKNYSIKINDLLFTIVGTIGESALYQGSENKIAFQRSVAIIRCNDSINPTFLLCSMDTNSISRQLMRSASTSAQSGVYLNDLASLTLYFPALEEQQKIGEFFQKLDKQIEQHEKKLENYQQLKKAMLQRIFV
ncbi:restriction endonuclease subunit S [Wohlfahrtiimonas populi]|uniref:restriction endonuclease subunit S n=1 Tax=Wohlfahrtiimonas populi TaxID=1940240 RepID=UPI001E3B3E31|nr:restriction endonuclease subunit S [Wohlfahrtiimonas populi]